MSKLQRRDEPSRPRVYLLADGAELLNHNAESCMLSRRRNMNARNGFALTVATLAAAFGSGCTTPYGYQTAPGQGPWRARWRRRIGRIG